MRSDVSVHGSGIPQVFIDLAQIVGALATAAGVLVALWVAVAGGVRQRRLDRRDQASKVAVYTERRKAGLAFSVSVLVVVNASASPVYDVVLGAGEFTPGGTAFLPGNETNVLVNALPPGVYDAGEAVGLAQWTKSENGVSTNRISFRDSRNVTITFTDGNGLHWQRDTRGRLSELQEAPIAARGLVEPLPRRQISAA